MKNKERKRERKTENIGRCNSQQVLKKKQKYKWPTWRPATAA